MKHVESFSVGRFWSEGKGSLYSNIRSSLWTSGGTGLCFLCRTQLWESTETQQLWTRQDISKHVSFLFLNEADHIYCLLDSNSNTHMKKQQHLTASCRNVRCDHSGSFSPPLPAAWCFLSTVKVQSVSCRNTNVHEHNYKQDYMTPVYYSLELDWWL